jgi:hypothetical protein
MIGPRLQVNGRGAQRSVPELLLKVGNIDPSVRRRNLCEGSFSYAVPCPQDSRIRSALWDMLAKI